MKVREDKKRGRCYFSKRLHLLNNAKGDRLHAKRLKGPHLLKVGQQIKGTQAALLSASQKRKVSATISRCVVGWLILTFPPRPAHPTPPSKPFFFEIIHVEPDVHRTMVWNEFGNVLL
jgi:hypothetical protein